MRINLALKSPKLRCRSTYTILGLHGETRGVQYFEKSDEYHLTMSAKEENVFTQIYSNQLWGDGSSNNPLSGGGSNPNLTVDYVNFVKETVRKLEIASVVDVGHGDWNMWRDYKFENVKYIGLDVAEGLSEKLNSSHGNVNRKFIYQSPTNFEYPQGDLLISKEVFQHLPIEDLKNFLKSAQKFEYVILCNGYYPTYLLPFRLRNIVKLRTRFQMLKSGRLPTWKEKFPKNNLEINAGDFRGIDLERKPFSTLLEDFDIIKKFDFGGHKRYGVVSRVYFLKRNK